MPWYDRLIGRKVQIQNAEGGQLPTNPLIGPYIPAYNSGARNSYVSYGAMVRELDRRWNGLSTYGAHLIQTLIEYRQNWIAGNGFSYVCKSERNAEILQKAVDANDLDSCFFRELVAESEIEGKLLLRIVADRSAGEISFRVQHIPWITTGYTVACEDYESAISGVSIPSGEGRSTEYRPDEVVYARFGGSRRYVNNPVPRLGTVLWSAEVVDRAVTDLRDLNHKFGAAFPSWTMPDAQSARQKALEISANKWEIGHADISTGTCRYVEPSGTGAAQLKDEIVRHMQIISARAGVPIHFLGYVELMSNRATAAELMEQVNATTSGARDTFEELFISVGKKILQKHTLATGELLDWSDVDCSIPQVTMAQIDQLVNVYLPLAQAGYISRASVMQRIPGIEYSEELGQIRKEEEELQNAAIMTFNRRSEAANNG